MTSSAASTIRNALSKINPISATGFAAHNSTFYDRVRPSYPASVLEQIQKELTKGAVEKDLNLLELGSGTVSSSSSSHVEWIRSRREADNSSTDEWL
jgi:hypothetical protein